MNRIFITSDTHGLLDVKKLQKLVLFQNLDYSDYVIICGDVGIGWDEQLTKELIEFYENLKTNILFIDGNHENFNELKNFPLQIWNGGYVHKISGHIMFLKRGEIFNILGNSFLALGGADSHDLNLRIEGENWFKEEEILKSDIDYALENIKKYNSKVDYILTHTPNGIFAKLLYEKFTQCGEDFPVFLQPKLKNNKSGLKLNEIANKVQFKSWFCGHWHIDDKIDKYVMLYENILEI